MKKIILLLFFSRILIYAQSGTTWTEQNSGVTVQLTSVSVAGFNIAWICGYNGTVLKTTNAGTNWINVSGNGISSTVLLINIFGIDANNALTAGYLGSNTFVYRTTNSGINWNQVFFQANGFINAVWMVSSNNGFMQGDPVGGRWSLWKTANSGLNWDSTGLYLPQAGSEAGWNNSLYISSPPNRIWFGTNNSRIYYSSNYGNNWIIQSTSPEVNSYAITSDNFSNAFAGGVSLLKTTNSGNNWAVISSMGTGNFGGITWNNLISGNNFFLRTWYVRSDNRIFFSSNEGNTWISDYTAPSGTYRHINNNRASSFYIWAVRNNGGISRGLVDIGGGINIISNEIPVSFTLSQNYPNPFNPVTKFRFSVPKKSLVKLMVYNSLGNEIENLLSEVLPPAVYEATWDASKYSSGVYFYRLEAKDFIQTKKMILIK
ncbi:MAG: T9SS type A sorting domain-containing protein [Chlorobi bacterium]|nr:T9SS type A sorting domain-containing protein [Chlorobiota bacterium]MCI0715855.1 T9SS type A sorting domain-containing protein [Chlorobiota bacterium]